MAAARRVVDVTAPLSGTVVALSDVPDPVFAQAMVGPGVGIAPDDPLEADAVRVVVVAPCAGRLASVYRHAVVVTVDAERSVLVHLGLDTFDLEGGWAHAAVQEGEAVAAGQPVLAWSPQAVRDAGRRTISPVVALQASADDVELRVAPGERVAEGDVLLRWR